MTIRKILQDGVARRAADIHLLSGSVPYWRIAGELSPVEGAAPLQPAELRTWLQEVVAPNVLQRVEAGEEIDMRLALPDTGRFRILLYKSGGQMGTTLRVIPHGPAPTPEQLQLPAALTRMLQAPQGLILIVGPSRSGKSTTLASLVATLNTRRESHIITIEDPVEFDIPSDKSLVRQRQVGRDTLSFEHALRYCLRADPDVVVLSEVRTLEAIMAMLTLAETGHLTIAGLHTPTPRHTIERLVDVFTHDRQNMVRKQLAAVLVGIVAQRLLNVPGQGYRLLSEVLVNTPDMQQAIRSADLPRIDTLIAEGRAHGMQSFAQSRQELER